MSSSFIPNNAFVQAVSTLRRKGYPYVKDDEEIPLDGMQQVQAQSTVPRELPIATTYAKDAEQAPAQSEIPLHQISTVEPLSKEQEIDLAPTAQDDKTRAAYQSLYNAGVPKPQMPDHSTEHHGFWGNAWQHLKHAGKGAAIGALLGSRAGGGGAIGGALLGGLTGGISPRAADTMEYNTFTEPKWEHDNQVAQEEAGRKAGIADHYAQTYGTALFDPNQKTQQAKTQEEVAKDRQERQTALETDRATKNTIARDRETRLAASQKLNNLRRLWEKGGITDPKDKAAFAQLSGVSGSLADAYVNGEATEDVDGQGRMVIVHKRTGKREVVTDPDTGQPVMSFKATQQQDRQRHEKEMESQGREHIGIAKRNSDTYANKTSAEKSAARREAVAAIREHENFKAQAVKYQGDATRLEAQANAATKDSDREKYQAQADEAKSNAEYYKDRANRRAQDAATDYPDFVQSGEGENGWRWGKVSPQASANTSTASRVAPKAPPRSSTPPQGGKIPRSVYDGMIADPKSGGKAAVDAWMQKNKLTFQD